MEGDRDGEIVPAITRIQQSVVVAVIGPREEDHETTRMSASTSFSTLDM